MASIVISGDTSGAVTLSAPAISGTTTLTLPTTSGTLVVTGGAQTVQFAAGSAASPSITFTGDTNTGIFSPAADSIAFTEGGVESMRIDSSGNVGIGTSSPAAPFQVSRSFADSAIEEIARFSRIGASPSSNNRAAALVFSDANNATLTAAVSGIRQNSNNDFNGALGFYTNNTGGSAATTVSQLTERMRIDSSGNVGIGTSSPATRLDVQAAVSATPVTNGVVRIVTTGSNPATGSGGGLLFAQQDSGGSFVNYGSITGSRVNNAANNRVDLCFATGSPSDSIAIAERMRITTNGAVGIGTTNPLYRLSVTNGTGTNSGVLSLDGPPASSIYFFTNCSAGSFNGLTVAGDPIIIGAQNQSLLVGVHDGSAIRFGDTDMRFGIDSSERMRIHSNSSVSILSGLALGSLSNVGASFAIGASVLPSGAGSAFLKWNSSSGAVTYDTSSRLVKDNIVDSPYGLSEVLQLQPRKYFRTDDQRDEIGLVADEVQQVLPEFVPMIPKSVITRNEEDIELVAGGVHYDKLTSVLIKAIQEQQAMIQELKARIDVLEGVK